jgi:hypothetical protein
MFEGKSCSHFGAFTNRNLGLANSSEALDRMGLRQRYAAAFNNIRPFCWSKILIQLVKEFIPPTPRRMMLERGAHSTWAKNAWALENGRESGDD